jgi:ankyrin repeat protein
MVGTSDGQRAISVLDGNGFLPVHCAAHGGNAGALAALAEAKADVATRTSRGDTALHLAAMGGHGDTVAMLLRMKADVVARNAAEWTPLHLAVLQGQACSPVPRRDPRFSLMNGHRLTT